MALEERPMIRISPIRAVSWSFLKGARGNHS
jgi:hypothetical protein